MESKKIRIAVFASGSGSNAERFFEHFKQSSLAEIALVCTNRPDAYVLERAARHQLPGWVFTNQQLAQSREVLHKLQQEGIDLIVLAGFLRLIPDYLIQAYPNRIINIHPALLPKWGGKGMWGQHVHQAVVAAGELESGITIHYVDANYDEGDVIFQTSCPLEPGDTAEEVAAKVLRLEHYHYPRVVEELVRKMQQEKHL
ncbi:phosphoribosylglycinamide formyltransferase [Cesiribacter andamanensis]|uniref:Phosphoribosylglycinamide formyltransferase n=1 Tax=Cesiribacter andamanensis AMV16 TaxID=1279009 RepID=M7N6Q5_9BACT|nr:phosphoribosylglycinamide formyltransferase [Cesiribacter andamanensis]EMR02967.1 Phosphoribosylglycinamide formyltransferase [Cesiribacter andamanensis AMV16]